MADNDTVISAGVDISPVNQGFVEIAAGAESMASKVKRSAEGASKAIDGMGSAGDMLGERLTRGETQMRRAIERAEAQIRGFQQTASERMEMQIEIKGLDRAKFEPYLSSLREAEQAQKSLNEAQRQASAHTAFIDSLKRQADTIGMTRAELLRYQAAQVGASSEAEKYIRAIESADSKTSFFSTTLGKTTAALGALGLSFSAGQLLQNFIQQTISAEQEQAQLAAALKSTGESAGWSQAQLNDMAASLSSASTFSSGEINKAQTRLMTYTGIVGQQFPRAMQAVVDMSARMGMSVESSAEQIGRALDIPSEGLSSLTRQGFRFTEEQKALVKALEETGRVGEAQGIILGALESSYAGAAAAARDTLGGAFIDVKNAANDLMTGDAGSMSGLKDSLNGLAETLRSSAFKEAFAGFIRLMVDASQTALQLTADLGLLLNGKMDIARFGALEGLTKVNAEIEKQKRLVDALQPKAGGGVVNSWFNWMNAGDFERAQSGLGKLMEQRTQLERQVQASGGFIPGLSGGSDSSTGQLESNLKAATDGLNSVAASAEKTNAYMARFSTGAAKMSAQIALAMEQAKKDFGGIVPPEVEAQITKFYTAQSEGAKSAAKATEDVKRAYAQLTGSISKSITDSLAEQEAATLGLTKAETDLLKLKKSGEWSKFEDWMQKDIAAKTASAAATERVTKAEQEFKKAKEAAEASAFTGLASLEEQVRKQIEANSAIGLGAKALGVIERARLRDSAALLRWQAGNELANSGSKQTYDLLMQQADAMERLINLKEDGDVRQAAYDTQKEFQKGWDETGKFIGETLSDYIMDGGKDASEYLRRLFRNLALQPTVNILTQGLFGSGSGASGSGGVGGLLGGNNGFSLSNFGGFGNSSMLATGSSWMASALGGGAFGGAGFFNGLSYGLANGLGGLSGVGSVMGSGATAMGIGNIIGSVAPWVAGAAALWSLISSLDGSGDPHRGAVGAWSTPNGSENWAAGATNYDADIGNTLEQLATLIGTSFTDFLTSFGSNANVLVQANWADDFDGEGESWGGFVLSMTDALGNWVNLIDWAADGVGRFGQARDFGAMEEGYNEYVAAVAESYAQGIVQAMKMIELPGWISGMLDGIADDASIEDINAVLAVISTIQNTFKLWGDNITGFSGLSDDALDSLMTFAGGFDALSTSMSTYYDRYYSEQEKIDNLTRQMTGALAEFGVALPDTTADFRTLVEQTMDSGDAGTELLSVLLAMSGTFYDVATATDTVTESLRSASDIAKERATLEERWLTAIGDTAAIAALARAEIHETNLALYDQVLAQEAANQAAQEAAAAEQALANSRASLEDQIFKLTATTAEQRAAELAALDESLRPLQERIHFLNDEKKAAEEAAAAAEKAAQERATLEERWMQATGDTAGIAARARDAIDETNLSLYDQVLAQEAANQAAQEAANALQQMYSDAGISGDQIAQILRDGMLGRLSQEEVGEQLAGQIVDGIHNSIAGGFAQQITDLFTSGIITPLLQAAATGSAMSGVVSQASMDAVLAQARASMTALQAILNDPALQQLMADLQITIKSLNIGAPKVAVSQNYSSGNYGKQIANDARSMISAWESVYDAILGSMTDLRDTILGTTEDEGNSFYEAQFAMLTAQARAGDQVAAEQLPEVIARLSEYAQSNSATLFDQNTSIAGYINSLEETQAYIAAFYKKAGGSLSDLEAWDTQSVHQAVSVAPVGVPANVIPAIDNSAMLNSLNSNSGNTALLAEVRAMRTELAAVKAELAAARSSAEDTAANTRNMSRTLDEVTNGGDAMFTKEVTT